MKKKGFKLLTLSLLLSLSIGGIAQAVEVNPGASIRQQSHVVKTYNGESQGEPIQTQVSYENGVEIIRYEGLPKLGVMGALSDHLFIVVDENGHNEAPHRIIDKYGNIFCQEKQKTQRTWEIRLHKSGLQDDSFVLGKVIGNNKVAYDWYSKEGDLLGQLPDVFNTEYGACSIRGIQENVLIVEEPVPFENGHPGFNGIYHYYDMQNGFKLLASYDARSDYEFGGGVPVINEGYCYIPEVELLEWNPDKLKVYDESRIRFGDEGTVQARKIDEFFLPYVRKLRGDDTPSMYSPNTGWLLGMGDYGFQAYNVKTNQMINITSWADEPSGSYFCYWWNNKITGYPYEFEKNGLMLLAVADKKTAGSNQAVVFNLNTGKRVNNQEYEIVQLPDYGERPMLYTQDPDNWYGYLNDNFESIAKYADATTFSNGYALVSNDKKTYSIINEKLEVVVPNAFEADIAANVGHGLFELGYMNPGNYYTYKYVYIGPQ